MRLGDKGGDWMMVPGRDKYRPAGAQANDEAGLGLGARVVRRAANKRQADNDANPTLRKK